MSKYCSQTSAVLAALRENMLDSVGALGRHAESCNTCARALGKDLAGHAPMEDLAALYAMGLIDRPLELEAADQAWIGQVAQMPAGSCPSEPAFKVPSSPATLTQPGAWGSLLAAAAAFAIFVGVGTWWSGPVEAPLDRPMTVEAPKAAARTESTQIEAPAAPAEKADEPAEKADEPAEKADEPVEKAKSRTSRRGKSVQTEDTPPARAVKSAKARPVKKKSAKVDEVDDLLGALGGGSKRRAKAPRAASKKAPSGNALMPERLSKSQILGIVKRSSGSIRRCKSKDPSGEGGTVIVRMTIGGNGRIKSAKATGKYQKTALGTCIEDKVRQLKFPQFSGAPMTINMPFRI